MSEKVSPELAELVTEASFATLESPLRNVKPGKKLQIGIPKETSLQENRVALKPASVGILVKNGHEITVESGAGITSNFKDNEYSEVGAQIVYDRKSIFSSHLIVKVQPPTLEELDLINQKSTVVSAFRGGLEVEGYLTKLLNRKVTAVGYEFLQDDEGGLPLVRAMSEIAGNATIPIAAEYLGNSNTGQGIILGGVTGVPPTKVVIIGAGTVAEYAARAAIGLGADVQIFDDHIYKLRRLKHAIGAQINSSTLDETTLTTALTSADVVIGAIRSENGQKLVITEEQVMGMKEGAVIIDVSIDQGGCVETSQLTTLKNPIFQKHGIVHYCVPNIASRVSKTASIAISNILTPILLKAGEAGGVEELLKSKIWFSRGVYAYKGYLTKLNLAKKYNLGFKDLDLLMAVGF